MATLRGWATTEASPTASAASPPALATASWCAGRHRCLRCSCRLALPNRVHAAEAPLHIACTLPPCTQVVDEFTKLKPDNPLAKYLPALCAVRMKGDVFTGLNGFEADVGKLKADPGEWAAPPVLASCNVAHHSLPPACWCGCATLAACPCELRCPPRRLHQGAVDRVQRPVHSARDELVQEDPVPRRPHQGTTVRRSDQREQRCRASCARRTAGCLDACLPLRPPAWLTAPLCRPLPCCSMARAGARSSRSTTFSMQRRRRWAALQPRAWTKRCG